jgi:sugar phosphate isomerase/epimerase
MIKLDRIGFFTPSIGIEDSLECLKFIKERNPLIQAWTLSPELAHEMKPGLSYETIVSEVVSGSIKVSSLSGYMDWTKAEKNDLRIEEFKRIIGQCRACKTNIVCTETGRNFTDRNDKRAWDMLLSSMKILTKEAEKSGVNIAIEMGPSDLVFGYDRFRKLQDAVESKSLKINFDPANLTLGGINPVEILRLLKDDVVQVHLKDGCREPRRQTPLTKGEVDFLSLFDILENNNYNGNYIIEQEYDAKTPRQAVSDAYESMKRILKV